MASVTVVTSTSTSVVAPDTTSTSTTFAATLQNNLPELTEEERRTFESLKCDSLDGYLEQLQNACKKHAERSVVNNALDWLGPLFRAMELLQPLVGAAAGMHPAGALAMGAVTGVVQAAGRLDQYQSSVLQNLARMGRKSKTISVYKHELYKDDVELQDLLAQAVVDILAFCRKGVRILDTKGNMKAKIEGLRLILFRSFDSQLGSLVQAFEATIDSIDARAAICDKRRLQRALDMIQTQRDDAVAGKIENRTLLQQQEDRIRDDIDKMSRRLIEQQSRSEKVAVKKWLLDWLSALDFVDLYDRNCALQLAGTGQWLLDLDKYQEWKYSDRSTVLWVKSKPGCGKSVLAAVAISNLSVCDPTAKLAYAFCKHEDQSTQDPASLMAALAKQIGREQPDIDVVLQEQYKASQQSKTPSLGAIRRIFKSVTERAGKVYIVVDAVDECVDPGELLELLLQPLEDEDSGIVKLIIFSRIDSAVNGYLRHYPQVIAEHGNRSDLSAYISYRFPDEHGPEGDNELVRNKCVEKADGMFQWVALLAQHVQNPPMARRQREESVEKIPPRLDAIYDEIFEKIWLQDESHRSIALLVLLWIIHARRPLKTPEMREAVANVVKCSTLDDLKGYRSQSPDYLLIVCYNLVYIDEEGYFRLIHDSVRHYLDQPVSKAKPALMEYLQTKVNAQQDLAEICLSYLQLEDFGEGPVRSFKEMVTLDSKAPFLEYASRFWAYHLPQVPSARLLRLVRKLLDSPPVRELSMQFALLQSGQEHNIWCFPGTSQPMHVLAVFGLPRFATEFLRDGRLEQDEDGAGITPLMYSVLLGHHDMSLWIIEQLRTANRLRLTDEIRKLIIHTAASRGWADILLIVLADDRAYIDSVADSYGRTPLIRAIDARASECVKILINYGANVDLKDGSGVPPIVAACEDGNAEVIEMLLDNKADPNSVDMTRDVTALYQLAWHNKAESTGKLLSAGADPKMKDKTGYTALHAAAAVQSLTFI